MMPVWLALLLVALFGFVCGGGGAFVFWAFVTGDLRRQIARLEEVRDLQSAEVAIRDHALYIAHRFDRLEGTTEEKYNPPMRGRQHEGYRTQGGIVTDYEQWRFPWRRRPRPQ